jgi:hypothetical protein
MKSRVWTAIAIIGLLVSLPLNNSVAGQQQAPSSIENIRSDQPLTQQQRDEINAKAQENLKKNKEYFEQLWKKADKKALKFEKEIIVTPGPITERDQKVVDELSVGALETPNAFRTESGAIKYLKIMLKGDHNSFRFFKVIQVEKERKTTFDEAMESALSRISSGNKSAVAVADEIIKRGNDYPRAAKESLRLSRKK